MKCPECGYTTYDESVRCSRCGATLKPDGYDSGREERNPFTLMDDTDTQEPGEQDSSNPLYDNSEDRREPYPGDAGSDKYRDTKRSYTEFYKKVKVEGSGHRQSRDLMLASLYERFFAFVIDLFLLLIGSQIVVASGFYFLGVSISEEFTSFQHLIIPAYVIIFILLSTYFLFAFRLFGRSIGKMAVGITIVPEYGHRLTAGASFMRWVGYYISAVPLFAGFFWAVIDPGNQAWHDKLAGTYVVKEGYR